MEILTDYPMAASLRRCPIVIAYIVWRMFQATVVIPASLLGACLLVYASVQDAPLKTAVEGFYRFADSSIRQAPPGYLLVAQCAAPGPLDPARKKLACEPIEPRQVPVHEATGATAAALSQVYSLLVMVSFGALVLFRPGPAFFGLRPAADERRASQ